MIGVLLRKIRLALYRRDYERMVDAAERGKYEVAALIAWALGEQALVEQYKAQAQVQMALRRTAPIVWNPYRRCALEYELKQRCN